jgi:hypothetical protein
MLNIKFEKNRYRFNTNLNDFMLLPHDSDMINKVKNYIKHYIQKHYKKSFQKRQLKNLNRSNKIIL